MLAWCLNIFVLILGQQDFLGPTDKVSGFFLYQYDMNSLCFQVVDLLIAMARSACKSSRKLVIFDPFPSVVNPGKPTELALNPKNKVSTRDPFGCKDAILPMYRLPLWWYALMTVLHLWCESIWVRSLNCGCLVTWFCYHLIAKPGNKTTAPS